MNEEVQCRKALQNHFQALQRSLGEASTSLRTAITSSAQNAALMLAMNKNREQVLSRLGAGNSQFASVNFARAADSGDPSRKKKKNKGASSERPAAPAPDTRDNNLPPQSSAKIAQQIKENASKERAANHKKEESSAVLRELDSVKEPPPTTSTEAAAQELGEARLHMNRRKKRRIDRKILRKLFRRIKAPYRGRRKKTLTKLQEKAMEDIEAKAISANEPNLRKKYRAEVMSEIPGSMLRQEAPKMQLRPWEHEALPLDRFGEGHLLSPARILGKEVGSISDFAWGMFGRVPRARQLLGRKWGGKDPEMVLRRQEFYNDIIDCAARMELTLMLVAQRPIPLVQLRDKFLERQSLVLRQKPNAEHIILPMIRENHKLILARIKKQVTEEAFKRTSLVDLKGNVRPESKLIVSVGPDWQLTAEAITPGPLGAQRMVKLGYWKDRQFARGILNNFLGMYNVDPLGKTAVGNGILYAANGFNFKNPEISGNRNQYYKEDDDYSSSSAIFNETIVPLRGTEFAIAATPTEPLLNNISRSQKYLRTMQ